MSEVTINPDVIVRLARWYSVVEMAQRPDFPSAETIYRLIAMDPKLARAFSKARNNYFQAIRIEIDDLLKRSHAADLGRLPLALRRLRKRYPTLSGEGAAYYDLEKLSDEELEIMFRLITKLTPPLKSETKESDKAP